MSYEFSYKHCLRQYAQIIEQDATGFKTRRNEVNWLFLFYEIKNYSIVCAKKSLAWMLNASRKCEKRPRFSFADLNRNVELKFFYKNWVIFFEW
jgi:hypothetical protein